MVNFWDGFEKNSGILDTLKGWFGNNKKTEPETKAPEDYEKKKPKYFYSKKFDSSYTKALNKAMKSNFKGGDSSVTLKYTKADGKKVTRKITPYTAKGGNVVVGYDHHRGALRSFRLDRISKIT